MTNNSEEINASQHNGANSNSLEHKDESQSISTNESLQKLDVASRDFSPTAKGSPYRYSKEEFLALKGNPDRHPSLSHDYDKYD